MRAHSNEAAQPRCKLAQSRVTPTDRYACAAWEAGPSCRSMVTGWLVGLGQAPRGSGAVRSCVGGAFGEGESWGARRRRTRRREEAADEAGEADEAADEAAAPSPDTTSGVGEPPLSVTFGDGGEAPTLVLDAARTITHAVRALP